MLFELFTSCRFLFFSIKVFLFFNGVNNTGLIQELNKLMHIKCLTQHLARSRYSTSYHSICGTGGNFHWSQCFTPSAVYAHPTPPHTPPPHGLRTCSGQGGVVRHALLHSCLLQKTMPQVAVGPKRMKDAWSRPALSPQFRIKLS